jgi:hypothetical protein
MSSASGTSLMSPWRLIQEAAGMAGRRRCRTAGHPQTGYFDSCPRTAPAGNSALWTLT